MRKRNLIVPFVFVLGVSSVIIFFIIHESHQLQVSIKAIQADTADNQVSIKAIQADAAVVRNAAVVRSDCEFCNKMDLNGNDRLPTAEYITVSSTKTTIPFQFLVRIEGEGDVYGPHVRDHRFWQGNVVRTFESILMPSCSKSSSPSLMVDIGGHMGWTSMISASCGCRVVAFEPMPTQAAIWKKNAIMNGFQNQMNLLNNAVSDTAMEMFMESHSAGVSSSIVSNKSPSTTSVHSVRLDEVLHPEQEILLMKIDVEGHEYPAWLSAQHYIKSQQTLNVVMEFNPSKIGLNNSLDILETAVKYGYSIFEVGYDARWEGNAWVGQNEFVPWWNTPSFNTMENWLGALHSCKIPNKDPPCGQVDLHFVLCNRQPHLQVCI